MTYRNNEKIKFLNYCKKIKPDASFSLLYFLSTTKTIYKLHKCLTKKRFPPEENNTIQKLKFVSQK